MLDALSSILEKHPEHTFRAQRAAYMVRQSNIKKVGSTYICVSASKPNKTYAIVRDKQSKLWICGCLDYMHENSPILVGTKQRACKHILAAMMYKKVLPELKQE